MRLKKYSIITWIILTTLLSIMLYKITLLEEKLVNLTYNQGLILMQLEESENNINSIMYLEDQLNSILEKVQNSNIVTKETARLMRKSSKLKETIN